MQSQAHIHTRELRTLQWLGVLCVLTGWGKKRKLKDIRTGLDNNGGGARGRESVSESLL